VETDSVPHCPPIVVALYEHPTPAHSLHKVVPAHVTPAGGQAGVHGWHSAVFNPSGLCGWFRLKAFTHWDHHPTVTVSLTNCILPPPLRIIRPTILLGDADSTMDDDLGDLDDIMVSKSEISRAHANYTSVPVERCWRWGARAGGGGGGCPPAHP
jgi:hypothetical protein